MNMSTTYTAGQLTNAIKLALAAVVDVTDTAVQRQYYGLVRDASAALMSGKPDAHGRVTQAFATLNINIGDLANPREIPAAGIRGLQNELATAREDLVTANAKIA